MKEYVTQLVSAEEIDKRVTELAEEISSYYAGESVVLVCLLKGGVMFMVDLAKKLELEIEFDFMDISSYNGGTESSGIIKINKDLENSIEGKHVLLVEDIIDSGRTVSHVLEHLEGRHPASIRLCTLLDKPDRRVIDDVKADYTGFCIPDEFVIGYGLDYQQRYRNLPFIGVLHLEEE